MKKHSNVKLPPLTYWWRSLGSFACVGGFVAYMAFLDYLASKTESMVDVDESVNKSMAIGHISEGVSSTVTTATEIPPTGLTFVNFQTTWCGHCRRLAPIWKELENSIGDRVNIVSVDCDEEEAVCRSYGVRGYPTLILFNNGTPIVNYRGARSLNSLTGFLSNFTDLAAQVNSGLKAEQDMEVAAFFQNDFINSFVS